MLKMLIPKVGIYAKFKKHYETYIGNIDTNINLSTMKRSISNLDPTTKQAPKKLKKDTDFCTDLDLSSLLQKTKKGELVYQNRENLTNADRQYLCQIIVEHFVNSGVSMGILEFQVMKEKIKEVFNKEAENINIYYTCPDKGAKNQKPKGKLPDKFFNFTKLLKKRNILEHTRVSSSSTTGISSIFFFNS
jgi:hypothetical protein